MTVIVIIVVVSLMLLAVAFASGFAVGQRHPADDVIEEIGEDAILDRFVGWYAGQEWKCVAVDRNGHGFMGMRDNNIIVESGQGERIRLRGYDSVPEGQLLRSRSATPQELRTGAWVSLADRYIKFEKAPEQAKN